LCATPGQYIPSADWMDLLSVDKWIHATLFFVLCTLWFITAIKYKKSNFTFTLIFLACVAYGGLLEIMQAKCFSNRSADWQDFVANSFGCLVAVLLLKRMRAFFLIQE
jgi:VanZ family protein